MFTWGSSTDKKHIIKKEAIFPLFAAYVVIAATVPSPYTIIASQNLEVTGLNILPSDAPIFDLFETQFTNMSSTMVSLYITIIGLD